jgi:hypothetical protein
MQKLPKIAEIERQYPVLYRGFTRRNADQIIARSAKTAKNRRNWNGKTLPLTTTDNTDLNGRKTTEGFSF